MHVCIRGRLAQPVIGLGGAGASPRSKGKGGQMPRNTCWRVSSGSSSVHVNKSRHQTSPRHAGLQTSLVPGTTRDSGTEADQSVHCLLQRERPQHTRSYDNAGSDSAGLLLSSASRTQNDEDVAKKRHRLDTEVTFPIFQTRLTGNAE